MKMKLLDAQDVACRLKALIEHHKEIHIAVAWGYDGALADCLIKNCQKFKSVTFGLAFCQTDPELIKKLVGKKNSFVAAADGKTFHPKLYYFRTDDTAEAIIGSSNFTAGGLLNNWEASIYVKGDANAAIFKQIRERLRGYDTMRKPITKDLADCYQLQFEAAKLFKKPKNPVLPGDKHGQQLMSPLLQMDWSKYVSAVKKDPHHAYKDRLNILRTSRCLFAGVNLFSELKEDERKAIAGFIGKQQAEKFNVNQVHVNDWGWFGSMTGAGDFKKLVNNNNELLAKAIDEIPLQGEVTKEQYDAFREHFLKAFAKSYQKGGVATATRLLALKRPDSFVCINNPNIDGITKALSIPKTTLNLDNYWDRVVEPIRVSRWYSTPRPSGDLAGLWDSRVAMLDAIYYSPN